MVYEGGKPYLSINESLYSIDDLDTVVDRDYQDAYNKATDFTVMLNKLPILNNITVSADGKTIDELTGIYEKMNDYEKTFIAEDTLSRYKKYTEKLAALRADALTDSGN